MSLRSIEILDWKFCILKLVSGIFIKFSLDRSSKTMKSFLFHPKSSFGSQDIQIFVTFSLVFYAFQIQKGKWKWNNL